MFSRLFLLVSLASPLLAQDGPQLFTLYCAACHGADGKGATGGTFPPLAESPWLAGDPDRAVKIVLKGLTGPVEVLGKTYNLEMPPQGAMLPDDQIAAILTHVRSSWGNQFPAVSADQVKAIRAAVDDRKTAWTSGEILALHPLPLEKTVLTNLISQVYAGKWSQIPDFSTLKALNVEEEHDGIISLTDSSLTDGFAMVWKAGFEAPVDGEYTFILDVDDAANVLIDGKSILDLGGPGPMDGSRSKQKKINLTKGSHQFRVEYLEISGNEGIALGWRGPGGRRWNWLTDTRAKTTPSRTPIPIEPTEGRPVIFRNFIAGTTPRAIGFGFPGGVNLAYSADDFGPELIWTGAFMDGAAKWVERGGDRSPPAGDKVVKLNNSRALPEDSRFRGYKLDAAGNPTFSVQIGERFLLDSWRSETGTLVRQLTLNGAGPSLDLLISDQPTPTLSIEGAPLQSSNGKVTLKLDPGKPVTLIYRWK